MILASQNAHKVEELRQILGDVELETLPDGIEMPPEDGDRHRLAGIADGPERAELIRLARTFVKEADSAVAFESARKGMHAAAASE